MSIEGLASNPQRAPHILLRAFNMESFPEFVIIRYDTQYVDTLQELQFLGTVRS